MAAASFEFQTWHAGQPTKRASDSFSTFILSGLLFNQIKFIVQIMTKSNFFIKSYSVLMKGITWSRDSHGLFDYESRHLTKKTLKASYESMIMRSGNDLSLNRYNNMRSFQEQCEAKKQMPEDMAMLKIVNRNNTFYLESATYQPHHVDIERNEQNGKTQESMYLVVRSLKVNNEKIVSAFFDLFNYLIVFLTIFGQFEN